MAETLWVGTSRWELGLARSGGGVEVQARGTGSEALDTVVAGEVCNTCVVYEVVTVASLSTIGMLTSVGYTTLALSGLRVVVLVVGASVGCLESVAAAEVGSAHVVNWVVAVGLSLAERVLTSGWCRSLALVGGDIVELAVLA